MTQIFTGTGLGTQGSSLGQLGSYGPKGSASLGSGGDSVYVNGANGNLVLKQSDGFLSDLGLGMDLFQTYNSRGEGTNPWHFNLETRLMFEGTPNTAGSIVKRIDEDGHLSRFTYDTNRKVYVADDGSIAKITFNNGSWQYVEGNGQTRYHYNSKGQLTSLSDQDGHTINISYENGHLSRITDNRDKQSITWSFSDGKLSDVTFTSDGKTVHQLHYDYDSQNRLVKVSRDLGNGKTYWIRYGYVGDTNLISDINQSDGTALHIDYDREGRVQRLVDGEGRISSYEYLSGKTVITNALGESWTYFYDADSRLTGIDGPENYQIRYYYEGKHLVKVIQGKQRWNFTYNDAGDCTRVEGPSGEVVQRTHDNDHRILTETRYQNFDGEHHPTKPHTTRYIYDEQGHLRFEVKSDGTVSEYRYDQDGLLLSTRRYLRGHFDTQSYGDDQSISLERLTQWSQQQNSKSVSLTSFSYDWRGNLCEEIHYTLIDEQGNGVLTKDALKSYYRFDAAGRLVEKSCNTDKGIAYTYYFYDGLGRLTRTIDNQQHNTIIEYDDEHHRMIKTDANGLQTISIYDKAGLLLCIQKLDKTHNFGSTIYRYDAASRLVSETDVSGKTNYYFYDAQGRLNARVTSSGQVSEYQYDNEGHCIKTHIYLKHIDTRGFQGFLPDWNSIKPKTSNQDRISQVIYNDLNQIAYQINAEGAVIAYQYDAEGRVISKTAYANRLAHFTPTQTLSFNDVAVQTNSKDRTISYYYDTQGRLIGEINGEGAVVGYSNDVEGNLIEKRHFANCVNKPHTGNWDLDVPIVNNKLDIRTFSLYNAAGLKIADLDAEGYLTEYRYDSRGLLIDTISYYTQLDYPFAPGEYTTLETLRPASHTNDHYKRYLYNDLNQLIEEQTQSGLITTYTYNETGQILSKTITDRKTHEARKQQYRYDALGRVIQSLDALGSLTLEKTGYLTQDEIEVIWQQHGIRYQYDNAGLLLSKTNSLNQTTRYLYNEDNLLTFTVNAEGSVTETRYNAFSQVETTILYHTQWKAKGDITTEELQQHIYEIADQRFDEITHYVYNSLGLVTSKSQGTSGKIKNIYNAFGELEQSNQLISLNHETIKSYEYDRRGLLRSLTEDLGGINKILETEYDMFGRMVRTIDGRQKSKFYSLNKRGEVYRITNSGLGKKEMSYDAFGRVLSVEDKGQFLYVYDDQNNTLTLMRTGESTSVVTEFNAFGDKITLTDRNKQKTIYQYDANGQLIHFDGPEHSTTDYQYNAEGQLVFEQKGKNHKISYTYDAEGRALTKITDPDGLNICTMFTYDGIGRQLSINEAGRITKFTYDNQGNLIKKCLDPNGLNLITEFSYTETGQLSRQTVYNAKGKNKVTSYKWDALGRCISTTVDPDGLSLTTSYTYDNNDNLISQTDAKKQSTQFVYDANNQLRYHIDARGVVIEHCYDEKGNEIKTITYVNRIASLIACDEANISEVLKPSINDQYKFYAYDKQSQLFMSYDGLGYATEYVYDGNDNVIAKKQHAIPSSIQILKSGKCPEPKDSTETRITYFVYDGLNQERYQVDPSGRVTEFCYDSTGQVIKKTRFAYALTIKEMDDNLSISSINAALQTDAPYDQTTYYAYDAAGRLQAQANPSGSITSYQYDDAGNLIATTAYANTLNNNTLNNENWSSQIQRSKNDRTTRAVFDAAGREVYRISATGKVVAREYDAVGNIITERVYAKSLIFKTYTLDEVNDILSSENIKEQLTSYKYDATGRLLTKTDALKHTTEYTYDENNNVASKTDANKACWTYRYDESNQLIETSSPKTKLSRYHNGTLIEEYRSVKTQNTYDSFGNLTSVIRDAEGSKQTIQYTYDVNNQKTATIYPDVMVNKAERNASAERQEEKKTLTETLAYNAFGDIISSTDKAGNTRHWAYDINGQMRYSIDAKNALTQYDYDAFDNLQKKTRFASPITLSKDSDYSVETIKEAQRSNDNDRTESYEYDKEGRLTETRKDTVISYNSRTGKYQNLSPTKKITYNAFGDVIQNEAQLSDNQWAITRFYYDLEGLKTAQIDAEGYLTQYTYNDFCLVESETQYAGRCKEWTSEDFKTPDSNSKDRTVTFSYDAMGQLTNKTLKGVTYQKLNGKTSKYDTIKGDLTSTYRYDAQGNLVSTTDPLGHTVYSYYNEVGQLTAKVGAVTQAGRSATTYKYDALGQLVETHQWANGAQTANETDFTLKGESNKDILTTDVYDTQGHLIQQKDGTGHQINYSFDANGNISRTWQVVQRTGKSALIQDKRYVFDAENHLIQSATIKSNNTYATDDAQYNAFGEVAAKGLNSKYTTHIDYDKIGRVWRSNVQGYYQIYVYDLGDHVTQVVTSTNAFGIENDEKGVDLSKSDFEKAINYNEQSWRYDLQRQDNIYDSLGRLLSQTKDGSTSIKDKKDKKVNDKASQVNELDRWGNVTKHTNANHHTTHYEYNDFDEVIKQILPEVKVVDEKGVAKIISPEIVFAYDALGRVIAMTDANTHTSAKVLDADGHIIQEIDALGHQRDKNYDLLGQLTSTSTKRNNSTVTVSYTYDKANRLLSVITPNTTQKYTYDEAGQLIKQSDRLDNDITFEYDELGHQIERVQRGRKTITGFDDAGHKVFEKDAKLHTQSWVYDDNGKLKEHTDLGGHKTVYTYNVNGLILTEKSVNGKKDKAFHYFSDGQMEQFVDNSRKEVVNFTYDDEGNVLSKESSAVDGWIVETDYYTYDALGRLTQVRRRNPNDKDKNKPNDDKSLLSIDYEYDAVGNIRDTKVMARYADHKAVTQNNYYLYDENNRMVLSKGQLQNGTIQMTTSQGSEISYDEMGNISAAKKYEGGAVHHYTYHYNEDNFLWAIKKDGHNLQTKKYDKAGNVIIEYRYNTKGNITQTNTMNYEKGLLTHINTYDLKDAGVSVTGYEYDEVGNITKLTTKVQAQGSSSAYTEVHSYTYELWDSYQQKEDKATRIIGDQDSQVGLSVRYYDANGQLESSIDKKTDAHGQSNTTKYSTSSLDGIRGRLDKEGETNYLTVAGKTIGDLRLDNNGASHLEVYGGFTPSGTPEQANGFMPSMWQNGILAAMKSFQNTSSGEATPPEAPQDSLGTYTLQSGDTLESIALQVYGDASLWYLIADANGISKIDNRAGERGSQMHLGQRINIPPAASGQHHTNATHKVLNGSDYIGNTSATIPLPPAPPAPKRHNSPWRILGRIAVAVIATVATVYTAGAIGAALGAAGSAGGLGALLGLGTTILGGGGGAAIAGSTLLGSVATGFAAGFIGSIAGQGAAAAFGLQNGIDIKGALITGLATAATAGVTNALSSNANYQNLMSSMDTHSLNAFSIRSATEMMERDVLSQGINMATRKHQHLDWLELSISTATAGFVGSNAGRDLNQNLEKTFKKAAPTVSSELQSLASGGITAAASHTHFNATQVITDTLGGAVGNNIVQANAVMGSEEAGESAVEAAKKALVEKENKIELEELMQAKANVKAEQSKGAWNNGYEKEASVDLDDQGKAQKMETQFANSPLALSGLSEDGYGEIYGSKTIGILNNVNSSGRGMLAIKNIENIYNIDYQKLLKSEDFKIYLSTINGEAGGQSPEAWVAIGNVINNRVGYREWSDYNTQTEIIEHTRFDAYWKKTDQYKMAYKLLSSGKLNSKFTKMLHVIAPVYLGLTNDTTHGAVLYYSPKTQKILASKSKEYKIVPNWKWAELSRVHPKGVEGDDFAFYRYK